MPQREELMYGCLDTIADMQRRLIQIENGGSLLDSPFQGVIGNTKYFDILNVNSCGFYTDEVRMRGLLWCSDDSLPVDCLVEMMWIL